MNWERWVYRIFTRIDILFGIHSEIFKGNNLTKILAFLDTITESMCNVSKVNGIDSFAISELNLAFKNAFFNPFVSSWSKFSNERQEDSNKRKVQFFKAKGILAVTLSRYTEMLSQITGVREDSGATGMYSLSRLW